MTEILTISSVSMGFIAGALFCLNAASTSARLIYEQSGIPWEFNSAVAQSLTLQHAQYLVGAVFLVASFSLQAAALVVPSGITAPEWLPRGFLLFLSVLVPMSILAWFAVTRRIAQVSRELVRIDQEERARIARHDAERVKKQ